MSENLAIFAAAQAYANEGQIILRDQSRMRDLAESRRLSRKQLDLIHEWQFLWACLADTLGPLNPFNSREVPESFVDLDHWVVQMNPLGQVPITFRFMRTEDKVWHWKQICYPKTVEKREQLHFCDWHYLNEPTTERLKIVLAFVAEMEKRITENTSDHA